MVLDVCSGSGSRIYVQFFRYFPLLSRGSKEAVLPVRCIVWRVATAATSRGFTGYSVVGVEVSFYRYFTLYNFKYKFCFSPSSYSTSLRFVLFLVLSSLLSSLLSFFPPFNVYCTICIRILILVSAATFQLHIVYFFYHFSFLSFVVFLSFFLWNTICPVSRERKIVLTRDIFSFNLQYAKMGFNYWRDNLYSESL